MIGRSGERGSGISVLAARHDDDDDDEITFSKMLKNWTSYNLISKMNQNSKRSLVQSVGTITASLQRDKRTPTNPSTH